MPRGTWAVVVRAGGRSLAVRRVTGGSFDFQVSLPRRRLDRPRRPRTRAHGRRASAAVQHVFGLPRSASHGAVRSATRSPSDAPSARGPVPFRARALSSWRTSSPGGAAPGTPERAFPAASTLKVAIAVEALRSARRQAGARLCSRLAAATDADRVGQRRRESRPSRSSAAAAASTSCCVALGIRETWMGGGYLRGTAARPPITLRVESQPSFRCCKYTTAFDLARLLTYIHLAAGGRGPLIRPLRTRLHAVGRPLPPLPARSGPRPGQARPVPRGRALRVAAQGGLDLDRSPRRRPRLLARRRLRGRRDDVGERRRRVVGRPRRPGRDLGAEAATTDSTSYRAGVKALLTGLLLLVPVAAPKPEIVSKPIPFPAARKAETAAYAQRHYGLRTWRLVRPRVIVEHYTASTTFSSAFSTFAVDARRLRAARAARDLRAFRDRPRRDDLPARPTGDDVPPYRGPELHGDRHRARRDERRRDPRQSPRSSTPPYG